MRQIRRLGVGDRLHFTYRSGQGQEMLRFKDARCGTGLHGMNVKNRGGRGGVVVGDNM